MVLASLAPVYRNREVRNIRWNNLCRAYSLHEDKKPRHVSFRKGCLMLSSSQNGLGVSYIGKTMDTKGVAITARLKGPLDNPQITLQSSPPLPLGSIMSYLLWAR